MRMKQSISQFETEFRAEAAESVQRREDLRERAAHRSRARRIERVHKAGTLRFVGLSIAIIATAVIVTIVMFETLALIAG
jgi:anti-sigma-K factor RskA